MQLTVFIKSVQRQSSQEDLNPLFFAQLTFSCVAATDSTLLCADGYL